MQLKTKKLIAREGLIILSILCISGLFVLIGNYFSKPKPIQFEPVPKWEDTQPINSESKVDLSFLPDQPTPGFIPDKPLPKISLLSKLTDIGFVILLLGYPAYWLSRFIFWAIKTLKQKEANG